MLNAVKELGEFAKSKNISLVKSSKLQSGKKETKSYALFVNIYEEPEDYGFKIMLEDFDIQNSGLYLFDEDATKGNVQAPFLPLTDVDKTFSKKICGWFSNFSNKVPGDETSPIRFQEINSFLQKNKGKIAEKLSEKLNDMSKKDKRYLGLKIAGKYLGEYDEIKNFWQESLETNEWHNGYCSVCGERTLVTVRTSAFQFDTIDKPGFITGGLNEKIAWRNIPVCKSCRSLLKAGKKFIEIYLTFKFYGLSYWLIPKFFVGENKLKEEILTELWKYSVKDISLGNTETVKEIKEQITNDDSEILSLLQEGDKIKDFLAVNFMFVKADNSAERILLHIEDVFPSQLKRIFQAKECVEDRFQELMEDFEEIWEKSQKKKKQSDKQSDWFERLKYYNFGKIRTFFQKTDPLKRNTDLDKYFLEIVNCVFKNKPIDWNFLTRFYMNTIRKAIANEKFYDIPVTEAMMNTEFFSFLGLINFSKEVSMPGSKFNYIFEEYGKTLNNPAKRAIFLLGALTEMLLAVQYKLRSSRPFLKKLKSLAMTADDIRALLPEIMNKFQEYDRWDLGKRELAEEISDLFLQSSESDWKMPVDEINFYFACGMNLEKRIAKILYGDHNNKEEVQ